MAADSGTSPIWIRVCAWCGLSLPGDGAMPEPAARSSISHGICPACRDEFIRAVLADTTGIRSAGPPTTEPR
jgi:hypothetical protein